MVDKVRESGLATIKSGGERVAAAAERISNPNNGLSADDAVQISIGKTEVKAGVKIVKVAEELDKALLDIV